MFWRTIGDPGMCAHQGIAQRVGTLPCKGTDGVQLFFIDWLTGIGDALYLLMTADMIGSEDALRIGLVQKVVEPEELMETVKIATN